MEIFLFLRSGDFIGQAQIIINNNKQYNNNFGTEVYVRYVDSVQIPQL
jgi:hypothetical protein